MIDKIISLRTQWISDGREIISSPKVRENDILFSQNAGDIFRHNVMLGLISWRLNEDPTSYFSQAIDDLKRYCEDAVVRKFSLDSMPLSSASMISSFIDRDFKFSLECVIDEPADLYLDCLIAEEINVSGERRSPKQGLDSLAKSKLQILAARTYKVYFDILDFDVEGTSLDDLTLSASVNYSDRANDKFYMGGQDVNGGGKYNNFVVDYRLGAILNHVGFVGNNIHSWRW